MKGPIFIIANARSGSNFLARTLAAHPNITATIEAEPMFGWVIEMVLSDAAEYAHWPELMAKYRKHKLDCSPKLYLDKSHPNLWLAEKLKIAFPKALFVGIERAPFASVASMLKHQGVMDWFGQWRQYPVPNRFLGITEELADSYDSLEPEQKCALRWLSHKRELRRLRLVIEKDLHIVSYESLLYNTQPVLDSLQSFLQLDTAIAKPENIDFRPLMKWQTVLTEESTQNILEVIGPEWSFV